MQINRSLRLFIPICSMLLALGTVAFQNIEYSNEQQLLKEQQERQLNQKNDAVEVAGLKVNES